MPLDFEPVAQLVLNEALRNVNRHSRPTEIVVRIASDGETFSLSIENDSARRRSRPRQRPRPAARRPRSPALRGPGRVGTSTTTAGASASSSRSVIGKWRPPQTGACASWSSMTTTSCSGAFRLLDQAPALGQALPRRLDRPEAVAACLKAQPDIVDMLLGTEIGRRRCRGDPQGQPGDPGRGGLAQRSSPAPTSCPRTGRRDRRRPRRAPRLRWARRSSAERSLDSLSTADVADRDRLDQQRRRSPVSCTFRRTRLRSTPPPSTVSSASVTGPRRPARRNGEDIRVSTLTRACAAPICRDSASTRGPPAVGRTCHRVANRAQKRPYSPRPGDRDEHDGGGGGRQLPELVEQAADELGADVFEQIGEGTQFAQPALFMASARAGRRRGSPMRPSTPATRSVSSGPGRRGRPGAERRPAPRRIRGHLMDEASQVRPGGMGVRPPLGGSRGRSRKSPAISS